MLLCFFYFPFFPLYANVQWVNGQYISENDLGLCVFKFTQLPDPTFAIFTISLTERTVRTFLTVLVIWLGSGQAIAATLPKSDKPSALSIYFANDSINGLKFSDSYETHNAGLIWHDPVWRLQLDTAIVSPKLGKSHRQGWTANRAYGELISLALEKSLGSNTMLGVSYISAGNFGFNHWQERVHQLLGYAGHEEDIEAARMPNAEWLGLTLRQTSPGWRFLPDQLSQNLSWRIIWGDARQAIGISFVSKKTSQPAKTEDNWKFHWQTGIDYVTKDAIVSASPVDATHRKWRPRFAIGISRQILGWHVSIRDTATLPTIATDDEVFLTLRIGLTKHFTGAAIK